jgi:hypothetical protein
MQGIGGNSMPESGGSTTQAGIYYQNAVATRYLGRMLDPLQHSPTESIVEVRVEAPEEVDDIVVAFASGRREFIQVKNKIQVSGDDWKRLWVAFANQLNSPGFKYYDKLILFLGTSDTKFELLEEACERAIGASNADEWWDRLTAGQKTFVENRVTGNLPEEQKHVAAVWNLLSHVEVRIETYKMVKESAPYWMPPSNLDNKVTLYKQLFELVTDYAKNKKAFTLDGLRDELLKQGVTIQAEKDDKLEKDINELLELFTQHAAFMEQDPTGGDPTALFNAVHRTKSNMGTKTRIMLGKGPLSVRFKDIQKQLNTLERDFWEEYPQVADLTVEMVSAKYSTSQSKEIVRAKLGDEVSDQASEFLRRRTLQIRESVEELVADLATTLGSI